MNHTVRHDLGIYTIRRKMQESGVTNPSDKIKEFTKTFVEKLEGFPLDDEIILRDNSFYDRSGQLISRIPI